MLQREAVAQADVVRRAATDAGAVREHLDVGATVVHLQGEVSRGVQDLMKVVGSDKDVTPKHEDEDRLAGVDDLPCTFREMLQAYVGRLWQSVIQATLVLFNIQ